MRTRRSSLLANPPRKVLSREQVEKRQEKAVRFLRDVVGDDEFADEIEGLSTEEYAERKKITLANPQRSDREIIEHALSQLPDQASHEDRVRAIEKAREALEALTPDCTEVEELEAARKAVAAVAEECQRRLRSERFVPLASASLPFPRLDKDEREAGEIVSELLEELPASLSHYQVETRIDTALKPLIRKIERRNRRRELVEHGRRHVPTVLSKLFGDGAITLDERFDAELRQDLEQAVTDGLKEELTGSETTWEVEEIVASVVDEELDLEPVEEEGDGQDEDYDKDE